MGPLCSAQAWGRPGSILLSTTADMQDTTSREGAHGTVGAAKNCPHPSWRSREKENWRHLQVTELVQSVGKGQSWVGLVWPQGILVPIIIEVRVPWPWGGLF